MRWNTPAAAMGSGIVQRNARRKFENDRSPISTVVEGRQAGHGREKHPPVLGEGVQRPEPLHRARLPFRQSGQAGCGWSFCALHGRFMRRFMMPQTDHRCCRAPWYISCSDGDLLRNSGRVAELRAVESCHSARWSAQEVCLPEQELPDMKDFFFIRAERTSTIRLNGLGQSRDYSMEDCRRRRAVEKAPSLERVICS